MPRAGRADQHRWRKAVRKGLSNARQAIGSTTGGERFFYGVLLLTGAALLVLGWLTEVHGWDSHHVYLVGLVDGLTGFCFGVPVAGVVIREITRRATEGTERRIAVHAVTSQLNYLRAVVEDHPSQATPFLPALDSESLSVSERLRRLAASARSAGQRVTATRIGIATPPSHPIRAELPEGTAAELRGAVDNDELWAAVGFSCTRLASDVSRLVAVLPPAAPSRPGLPDWFTGLVGALQTLLVIQLPAQYKWLRAAVKDPPATVEIIQPRINSPATGGASPVGLAIARATDEVKEELLALARHLQALAALIDAGDRASGPLTELADDRGATTP